jgi:hypothetical protein
MAPVTSLMMTWREYRLFGSFAAVPVVGTLGLFGNIENSDRIVNNDVGMALATLHSERVCGALVTGLSIREFVLCVRMKLAMRSDYASR